MISLQEKSTVVNDLVKYYEFQLQVAVYYSKVFPVACQWVWSVLDLSACLKLLEKTCLKLLVRHVLILQVKHVLSY